MTNMELSITSSFKVGERASFVEASMSKEGSLISTLRALNLDLGNLRVGVSASTDPEGRLRRFILTVIQPQDQENVVASYILDLTSRKLTIAEGRARRLEVKEEDRAKVISQLPDLLSSMRQGPLMHFRSRVINLDTGAEEAT
jgi:predicted AlkP superfamily phosphohydrolase/phosphomutase